MTEKKRTHKVVRHRVRTSDGGTKEIKLTRGLAIKLACTECLGWGENPKECTSPMCPLFPYRGRTMASMESE